MATVTDVTDMALPEGGAELGEAAHNTPGMPQLDFSTYPNQIFWLIVALVVIYLILSRVALPRIGAVLAERQGTVTNDIAAAEDLRRKAHEAEEAYDRSLAEARSEAQRIAEKARGEIQADLDEAIAKADAEIAARTAESEKEIAAIREEAARNVREVARETAAEIVSAFGGHADASAVDSAVASNMERRS